MPQSSPSHERDPKALLVGLLLIFLVGIYFIGKNVFFEKGGKSAPSPPVIVDKQTGVPLMTPAVLLKKIQNGELMTLLDIRDEMSFQTEHLPHSISVPLSSLGNFSPVKDEAAVIIFSENDPAAFETAKNILEQKSFTYFFLAGGFEGWTAANHPTISVGNPNSFIDQSKVTYMTVEEYKKLLAENPTSFFLLDIQTNENFTVKHLKGATNIPLTQLEKRSKEIPIGKQIIVYGENDLASFQGGVRLYDLGILSARVLKGDTLTPASGLPLEP